MSSPVKLYGTSGSTCSMRVLFTAFELGHPVELIPVDMAKGEHKQPAHLARQPFGKVPAAEDGDLSFYESRAITRYLVDKYANESTIKLVPTDIKKKAIFEQWASLESTTYTPHITTILVDYFGRNFYKLARNDEACKNAAANLKKDGPILNKHLDDNEWLANNEFSLVDIHMVTYLYYIVNEPEIKEWFNENPNINAWYKRTTARPAFQQVLAGLKH